MLIVVWLLESNQKNKSLIRKIVKGSGADDDFGSRQQVNYVVFAWHDVDRVVS